MQKTIVTIRRVNKKGSIVVTVVCLPDDTEERPALETPRWKFPKENKKGLDNSENNL